MRDSSYEKQQENSQTNDRELPPLPQRALQGLVEPWISPNGSPFHTVRIWEFPLLYVVLKRKVWQRLSKSLTSERNLAAFSRRFKISRSILANIVSNPNQSISVPKLLKLSNAYKYDLDWVEQSIKSVMFNFCGEKEYLSFPFTMDIYMWRVICHIPGDGNVHTKKKTKKRKTLYPDLRWTQWPAKGEASHEELPPNTQRFMRSLLERLSRLPGGYGNNVNYPKALSYAIMGTMPGMTLNDLRTPKFIQFIIDLPSDYRDFKVQFLTAFIIDDGSIIGKLTITQKDRDILESILLLCDQLGYNHSHIYKEIRNEIHSFQLISQGIIAFHRDIHNILIKFPHLGLWHKSHLLEILIENISEKRLEENQKAIEVQKCIITVMIDSKIRNTSEIRNHPAIKPLVKNYIYKIFNDRIRFLNSIGILLEVKKTNEGSYRPKRWHIPSGNNLEILLQLFRDSYGRRDHKQSYERKNVTLQLAKEAKMRVITRGDKATPTNIAREGGFSRRLFYKRADLHVILENNEEE